MSRVYSRLVEAAQLTILAVVAALVATKAPGLVALVFGESP